MIEGREVGMAGFATGGAIIKYGYGLFFIFFFTFQRRMEFSFDFFLLSIPGQKEGNFACVLIFDLSLSPVLPTGPTYAYHSYIQKMHNIHNIHFLLSYVEKPHSSLND